MKSKIDYTDDDLRLALQSLDERNARPLSADFADKVMERVSQDNDRSKPNRRKSIVRWAVAASIVLIAGLSIALWPKTQDSVYEDTFSSVEEACLVLSNNMDSKTIAL